MARTKPPIPREETIRKLKLTMPKEVDAIRNDLIAKIKVRAGSISKNKLTN